MDSHNSTNISCQVTSTCSAGQILSRAGSEESYNNTADTIVNTALEEDSDDASRELEIIHKKALYTIV